jgi:hypothetical protein
MENTHNNRSGLNSEMGKGLRVLVGCEYSGRVRDAFAALGFDAWSCDILETETPGQHYKCDIFEVVNQKWDLFIGFPPCTFLSSAGLHYCDIKKHGQKAIDRIKKRNKAIEFFLDLYSLPIDHICLENPLGHISANILKPDQIIHPYYFGEREMKRTALWLKNLPLLQHYKQDDLFNTHTHTLKPVPYQTQIRKATGKIKNRYFTDSFTDNRLKTGHEKSKLFQSIANEMAIQWSSYIINKK